MKRLRRAVVLSTLLLWTTFAAAQQAPDAVNLSLFFENGSMRPLTFYGNPPRYLNEVDLSFMGPPRNTDDGISDVMHSGDIASLDWTGVRMVEETWDPTGRTFQRHRFYRHAAWM